MECSHERNINTKLIEKNIAATLNRIRIFDPTNSPLIKVFPENGELAIKVQSLLEKGFESRLKSSMKKGVDNDVLVFTCMGNTSTGAFNANVDLTCSIVTENGLPVALEKSSYNNNLGNLVQKARDEIIAVFQNARQGSTGCVVR